MSNTGHKCISASYDTQGNPWRFQVTVQWEGKIMKATEYTLEDALALRDSFELALNKPRTEKHIRSNTSGVHLAVDSFGNRSWCAQIGNKRRYFSVRKYKGKARQMAVDARKEMEHEELVGGLG